MSRDRLLIDVLDAVSDGVVAIDHTGRCLACNAPARQLLGPPPGDVLDASDWLGWFGPLTHVGEPFPPARFPLGRALAGETCQETLLVRGTRVSVTGQPLRSSDDSVQGAVIALRPIEVDFANQVIDAVAHPIFVKDRDFRFVLLNRALCGMVGYPAEKMIGRTDYDFFPREQADFFRHKDRELFTSGQPVDIADEPITDASGQVHVLATTKVPLRDPSGDVTHLVGIIHDITQLKLADEARSAALAQLELVNRELEAFSYSVSHDLQAPARRIDGFSQVLLDGHREQLDEQGRHYLERIQASAKEMGQLIDSLLSLGRVVSGEMRTGSADLGVLARECAAEIRLLDAEREVDFVIMDTGDSGMVAGDPRLLRLLLQNLLANAWKFTSTRARSRIEFGSDELAGERVFFVRDNGVGFSMADAGRLFAPFRRLHAAPEFPGTGIGLATAQRIVHRHGGRIWAESFPDQGATFYFVLPGGVK